jgi:hypothetical protein
MDVVHNKQGMMKSTEDKEYEERVKQRVLILKELISSGQISISEDLKDQVESSLLNVRLDQNGEPILDTVDSFVRSMALMAEHIDYRQKIKDAISLQKIQTEYFNIIVGNFNQFYKIMIENGSNPHNVAKAIAYGERDISYLDEPIQQLVNSLAEFWELVAESGYLHLADDFDSIKAVYGGDLFPAHNENVASKCGIYTDTIILPCPFIRSKNIFNVWNKEERVYYLIKHALNILQYKELALVELDRPIVAILPDKELLGEFAIEEIRKLGEKDALYHAQKVFGRIFNSTDELLEFGESLDTVEKVSKEIKDPKRVLFNSEIKDTLEIQLKHQIDGKSLISKRTTNPGIIVAMNGYGRMGVCNELLVKSTKIGGIPLIDAPTSWEFFKWKLEYDSERTYPNKTHSQLHLIKGLNGLNNTSLKWLGKIPPECLIELRKDGAINEIRAILSKGIDELVQANELDFRNTSHKVFNNLNIAFNQHEENIKKLLNKKWKIAGKDFGSWIVMGTVEIASACLGTPLYGLSTVALNQILDPPKIKDFPQSIEKIRETQREKEALKKSPIGLMFNYKK